MIVELESVAQRPKIVVQRLVAATPAELRAAADALEASARTLIPGESVLYGLTNNLTLVYKPIQSISNYILHEK